MVPIILGTIAELLAAFWSMNDVCEAQKMSKTAFTRIYLVKVEPKASIFLAKFGVCSDPCAPFALGDHGHSVFECF